MIDCPLASVILPAYNAAPYLPRCLDSLLAQTADSFELIMIDDGSTDGTGNICDAWAARDARIPGSAVSPSGDSRPFRLKMKFLPPAMST